MGTPQPLRVIELYSGIGGMHWALQESGMDYGIVAAMDIHAGANAVYQHNFPCAPSKARNILSLTAQELNALQPTAMVMSPPCQPFTRVGLKLDVDDPRSSSFLHLLKLLPTIPSLDFIFVENVVGFEVSLMRDQLVDSLQQCQIYFREFLLSPRDCGIPNSRARYYLVGRRHADFSWPADLLKEYPFCLCEPEQHNCKLPRRFFSSYTRPPGLVPQRALKAYLEDIDEEELKSYILSDKVLERHYYVLDIRTPEDDHTCCFTKAYTHYAEGTGSVLQHNGNVDWKRVCAEVAQAQTSGQQDVALEKLRSLQLRYFTPREVSNLMGFPHDFSFPKHVSNKARYKMLGNSLNVQVVALLLQLWHSE
nr:EOG090X0A4V [Triops cancriformis]